MKGFGVITRPNGRKVFIAQFRIGAGRAAKEKRATIGSYGTWTVDLARAKAAELIREGQSGVDRQAINEAANLAAEQSRAEVEKQRRLARELRLNRIAARFMQEHVRLKRKPNTIRFYRMVIAKHILPVLGRKDAREITRQEVAQLHSGLIDTKATANRVVAILSAIYGWAEGKEILPSGTLSPTRKLEKFREVAKERFLDIAELERLGAAIRMAETDGIAWEVKPNKHSKHIPKTDQFTRIDPDAAAALRMLIFTGARLREVLNLTWQEVDLERGLLRLKDSKTGRKTILLNGPARAVLSSLVRRSEFVFPGESREGTAQPRTDLKRPWNLVTKAAGLEGLRIHDLRHSFASAGASDGQSLVVIGKLLGHSQSSTTERYAHMAGDSLRQASDAIASKIAAAMGEAPAQPSAQIIPLKREGK